MTDAPGHIIILGSCIMAGYLLGGFLGAMCGVVGFLVLEAMG
jgi:hypothetical protein